jgi:hypothetical protein
MLRASIPCPNGCGAEISEYFHVFEHLDCKAQAQAELQAMAARLERQLRVLTAEMKGVRLPFFQWWR